MAHNHSCTRNLELIFFNFYLSPTVLTYKRCNPCEDWRQGSSSPEPALCFLWDNGFQPISFLSIPHYLFCNTNNSSQFIANLFPWSYLSIFNQTSQDSKTKASIQGSLLPSDFRPLHFPAQELQNFLPKVPNQQSLLAQRRSYLCLHWKWRRYWVVCC